jgi:class 3 adenylate cyclase/tetratricopeptide (TPR) repeat protein
LTQACPSCGTPITSATKFCGECGTPLTLGATPPAAPPALAQPLREIPTAERRLVSVLFADLVGFTTLSESRDAEDVRELLSKYFDTCKTLISRYGGVVEKFIGDAVMAVWGTPVATEDDAERAVRAALDLTAAVAALGEEAGASDLRARAGVLTGEAAVTLGAEGQGMVAGDMVNTASRIQSAAPPGVVFVGESTKRATEATIAYEDAGAFELKGKAESVPLWRALRVVAGVRGSLKSTGLEAPFVGRDRELRMTKELFHATSEEKKAHLVSVIGMAGIGKSRLSWEFYKYFDGLQKEIFYHRGRCLSYGEGVAYWALAEMVKMRARIAEEEEPVSALAKLRASITEIVPDPEERKWVEPRLAHLLGLEERTAADKEDLFAAWRLFFERMAEQDPVVMVFEDMHWADTSLLDFVEYLLEWSRNFPIYMVTLARPELTDRRPTWGAGKRNFTSLYLEPLSAEAMGALMSGMVPGLPADVEEQILARAEGVPLYAVETVRMLLDRGLLVQEGAVYRPTGPIEALEVPETLHALVAARLDGLSPDERRVVQDGAVLGKSFLKQGVSAVSGMSEEELEPILASIVRKEVVSLVSDPRSPERGQYAFLQDLLKTVAYETLAKKDRKAKHLAAAAFIEETWAAEEEEIVEVVASHYLRAYEAAPESDDAIAIKAKARGMLARAGERAASLAASEEAQHYFEQALALADEPLELAELHERAGQMAWRGGLAGDASGHFEKAIEGFGSIGLSHPAARLSAALAEIIWQEGRIEEAVERMESAFTVLSGEEPDADLATLAAELGRLYYFMGRRREALEKLELALEIAEALRLLEVLSQALNTKAMILAAQGRAEEGSALMERAIRVAVENDLANAAIRAYNNFSVLTSDQDRHEEVLRSITPEALELARRFGSHRWERRILVAEIYELYLVGRWDEAVARGRELLDADDSVRGDLLEVLGLSIIHAHRGELDDARRILATMPEAESSGDVQERAVYLSFLAPVLRAEGRLQEALAAAEGAFAAREELGIRSGTAKDGAVETLEAAFALGDMSKVEEVLGILEALLPGETTPFISAQGARFGARLAELKGDADGAEAGFASAVELFGGLSMPFWLAVSLLEHGEWLVSQRRDSDAEPLLAESREIFERLKAKPWLDRVGNLQHAGVSLPAS